LAANNGKTSERGSTAESQHCSAEVARAGLGRLNRVRFAASDKTIAVKLIPDSVVFARFVGRDLLCRALK
jgi:hypothetical protein